MPYEQSTGDLRRAYDEVLQTMSDTQVDSVGPSLSVMSLRPEALRARMHLAHTVAFGGSALGRRKEELINVAVAGMLGCKH